MVLLENKPVAVSSSRMGRPPLGVKPTTIRLPVEIIDRIEAVAGKHKLASFIRQAVDHELERCEKPAT